MTVLENKKWITLLCAHYPLIDPARNCDQYREEGYNGTPESDAWYEIVDLSEQAEISLEDAAHIVLKRALGSRGLAEARLVYSTGEMNDHLKYACRVVALSVLREQNDSEFATDIGTVDAQAARLLEAPQERWSKDLLANFPNLGLEFSTEALSTEHDCTTQRHRFAELQSRIDEVSWSHDGDYAGAVRWILQTSLGSEGFVRACRSQREGVWDENIRYQCRIASLANLRNSHCETAHFSLSQVDHALPGILSKDALMEDQKYTSKRVHRRL